MKRRRAGKSPLHHVLGALASAIVLTVALLCPGRADAQQDNATETRAEQLFRSGERKFDTGDHAAACTDFSESLRLAPKLGTLLNLALCHETVGRIATAWAEYTHAAAWAAQNGARDRERHDFAVTHALALESRLSRILLQLPEGHAISNVELDGEPLPGPRWALPLFVDPGEHTVAVSAPGKKRATVTFRVATGAADQIVLVPALADVELPVAAPKPPPPGDPDPRRLRRMGGYVALGLGVAALAVGTGYGIQTIETRDAIGTHCARNVCDADGARLYRDAQGFATVSTIGFAAGVVGLGVGTFMVLTGQPVRSARTALTPRFGVGRGGAEVGLGGEF